MPVVLIAVVLAMILFSTHRLRAIGEEPATQLRMAVTELIELQKAAYTATSDWEVQKAQLDARTELLDHQILKMRGNLEAIQKARVSRAEGQARLQKELADRKAVLLDCAASLGKTEDRLKGMASQLPSPLLADLKKSLVALPGDASPVTIDNVAGRLQEVLTLLTEIRQFDAGIHPMKEILTPPDGKKQEMDVLYIGLGTAFAVSRDGKNAARAAAGPDGWQWEWNPEWASAIRRSIDIHRKEQPAAFVPLPLKLEGAAK